jgi:hypothetical protein
MLQIVVLQEIRRQGMNTSGKKIIHSISPDSAGHFGTDFLVKKEKGRIN